MKKKAIRAVLAIFLMAVFLSVLGGCFSPARTEDRLRIVTTVFPEYDWVREILGEREKDVDLTLLSDSGADLHSFQPTADDVVQIASCDLFLYIGGASDRWVPDVLKKAINREMIALNMMELLGGAVKEEEIKAGMQEEEEDEEEGAEYDEHIWLSLKNAVLLCRKIADALGEADPGHAADYAANCAAYMEKLNALDQRYAETIENAPKKTLLFGDRFPFRYLADDYGLDYYAAFAGCSAETEASFETISFLSDKLEKLGLGAVLTIEGGDQRIAETIIANTKTRDQKILSLNSLQSVTTRAAEEVRYLAVMEKNLEVIRDALQG